MEDKWLEQLKEVKCLPESDLKLPLWKSIRNFYRRK